MPGGLKRTFTGLLLCFGTGCGTITVGTDLTEAGDGGSSSRRRNDGAPIVDDPVDSGPSDLGCIARTRPAAPQRWPFAATKVAYKREFWDVLPGRATCSLGACHGGTVAPRIPATDADLDSATTLADSIEQLWVRAVPIAQPDSSTPVAVLLWNHNPRRPQPVAPVYSQDQINFINTFLGRALDCAWIPVLQAGGDAGTGCATGGLCDCPLPILDLSYCNQ